MKLSALLGLAFVLVLVAPGARADVVVYRLPDDPTASYAQSYWEQMNAQPRRAQAPPAAPCGCSSVCVFPLASDSLPPMPRSRIAQQDRTIYFNFAKAKLNSEAKVKLDTLAPRLMSADNVTGTQIIGYADRIGTISYNEALSRKRAENVRIFLINHGFIKPSNIETLWVGKSRASTHCSKHIPRAQLFRCLQPDRRVEVKINYRPQPSRWPVN